MRLIDADALDKKLGEITKEPDYQHEGEDWCVGVMIAQSEASEMPTIDALVLPCKIGAPVWFVGTNNINRLKAGVIETTVEKLVLKSGGIYMKLACNAMYETSCRSIGKSVFFSREEAEAALARMDGGDAG